MDQKTLIDLIQKKIDQNTKWIKEFPAEYIPRPNPNKTKVKYSPSQDTYLYLEDVAHDVGAILHDKWLDDKPKALMALPGVELGYDEVARLYRQYREKGSLLRFIIELYKEV